MKHYLGDAAPAALAAPAPVPGAPGAVPRLDFDFSGSNMSAAVAQDTRRHDAYMQAVRDIQAQRGILTRERTDARPTAQAQTATPVPVMPADVSPGAPMTAEAGPPGMSPDASPEGMTDAVPAALPFPVQFSGRGDNQSQWVALSDINALGFNPNNKQELQNFLRQYGSMSTDFSGNPMVVIERGPQNDPRRFIQLTQGQFILGMTGQRGNIADMGLQFTTPPGAQASASTVRMPVSIAAPGDMSPAAAQPDRAVQIPANAMSLSQRGEPIGMASRTAAAMQRAAPRPQGAFQRAPTGWIPGAFARRRAAGLMGLGMLAPSSYWRNVQAQQAARAVGPPAVANPASPPRPTPNVTASFVSPLAFDPSRSRQATPLERSRWQERLRREAAAEQVASDQELIAARAAAGLDAEGRPMEDAEFPEQQNRRVFPLLAAAGALAYAFL